MTITIVCAFTCTRQDETSSRMFTVGNAYPVVQLGIPGSHAGYVKDDLGHIRYIPSRPHAFIVENNSRPFLPDVRHAWFEPIQEELP